MSAHFQLSSELLADASFQLLASSTLNRYVRYARAFAAADELASAANVSTSILVSEADQTWRKLLLSERRDVSEIVLAVLLTLLSRRSSSEVDELLRRIALIEAPAVTWISALARRLLRTRGSNESVLLESLTTSFQLTVNSISAEAEEFGLVEGAQEVLVSSVDSSEQTLYLQVA